MATTHPWRFLAAWALVFVLGAVSTGALLSSGLTADGTLTTDVESLRATELIEQRLPERAVEQELVLLRSDSLATDDAAYGDFVAALAGDIRALDGVGRVTTPLDVPNPAGMVSADGHAALIEVQLADDPVEHVEPLIDLVAAADGRDGFDTAITGVATVGRDFDAVAEEDLRQGELQFGLPAALVVLLLVFGTLTGALVPLVMAALSIVVALGVLAVVGQVFELNLFVTNMVVAMGLALGIDYSLFIVSRLREERARGADTREAILNAAGTATRAVVFSGSAFALAMVGMLVMPDTILRSLAAGAVVVGLVSVAAALTFHPALLMVLGDRIDRLRVPWLGRRVAASAGREGRFWGSVVRGVIRRPGISLFASVALLVALASPLLGLKLGFAGPATLPDSTVAKQGIVTLERDFPSGAMAPAQVVVDERAVPRAADGLARLARLLGNDEGFAAQAAVTGGGNGLALLAVPVTADPSSEAATAAVDRLRERHVPAAFGAQAGEVLVGGGPALNRDYFALVERWLPIVIAVVLGLSVVLLTLAFRSVAIPLTAIAVNLLSVGAAYGLLVVMFQQGLGETLFGFAQVDQIEAWVPVFLFSVLFGLSMDYQVFLLSRIRERHLLTGSTTEAVVHGVGSTARLITGAALIIVVVFAGFATGSLVSFQQMGFGVAVALLIDATLVRSVVIPAAMTLLGERNWVLPRWLGWLPRVGIEAPARTAAVASERVAA